MDTRLRILKEAGVLFGRYGIRSVTMDTIADHLGISKRTIYENFKDKDDLLLQSIQEGIAFHRNYILDAIQKAPNVIVAIFQIIESSCEMQAKINPLFFQDLKKHHSKTFRQISDNSDFTNEKIIHNLIRKGINEGTFIKDINIQIVNLFVSEIVRWLNDPKFTNLGYSMEEIHNNTFGFILRGM